MFLMLKCVVNEQHYYILIKMLYSKTFLGKEQKEYCIRCEGYTIDERMKNIYVVHCVVWQKSYQFFFWNHKQSANLKYCSTKFQGTKYSCLMKLQSTHLNIFINFVKYFDNLLTLSINIISIRTALARPLYYINVTRLKNNSEA